MNIRQVVTSTQRNTLWREGRAWYSSRF